MCGQCAERCAFVVQAFPVLFAETGSEADFTIDCPVCWKIQVYRFSQTGTEVSNDFDQSHCAHLTVLPVRTSLNFKAFFLD